MTLNCAFEPPAPGSGRARASGWARIVFLVGIALIAAIWSIGTADAADDVDYKLGPQDKLKVRVYEWRPSRDEIYEWSALNSEYTVGASGKVSLPLVGEVRATGTTTAELSQIIGGLLKSRIGLAERPDVSIEIVQFRPFYIVGGVEKPGEYPFRPGMNVLQAVTVSGGLRRASDLASLRLEREVISSKGDLELLANELSLLLARKARLEAELRRVDAIEFPPSLSDRARNEPAISQLLEQERLVFQARREGLDTQLTALRQLKSFLEKEVVSMSGQVGTHNTQLKLLKEELASVVGLTEKGLATAPRRLALERNVAQLEGEGMRLDSTLLRTRQEVSRTEISILELYNKRVTDVTAELQQTQSNIERISQKTETSEKLLYESEVIAPRQFSDRGRSRRGGPTFRITRTVDGQAVEMTASEVTAVEPGDTIKVEMASSSSDLGVTLPSSSDEAAPLSSSPQRFSQDLLGRVQK